MSAVTHHVVLPASVHCSAPVSQHGSDVILRSSDHVDFYVYKIVLSLVSPFFEDMFSLPQPPNRTEPPQHLRLTSQKTVKLWTLSYASVIQFATPTSQKLPMPPMFWKRR
jgi:BTB/POZ domain